ncbi:MarR family winged helix-turn-helix transcriptional regulator [Streptomyces sp. I05A-00742]|uniref:MarR family winged helix-turn-helix transcriptional regulator n=1 Tax=Streptomyces sp. I05A-00742 TaxID=2732853 RepID=UPI001488FD1E|nr:MarR family winged helix-turn-helix transcriptional regulator [Streptomyces sp. I05A-00742]
MPASSASAQDLRRLASGLATVLPALHRALDRRLAQDFPHPKLPEGQRALLRLVGERDGITVRAAAEALLMKPNNVSASVSQLADQGLLERRGDPADRRVAHLHLTAEARHRLDLVGDLMNGYLTEALRVLSDGDLDALGSALGALNAVTHRVHPAAG